MRRRTLALAVTVLVIAGCGAATEPAPEAGAGTTAAEEAATTEPGRMSAPTPQSGSTSQSAGPSVPEVLDFTATTVKGDAFDGASLAGKPAVLWFWAPWCPVCKQGADDVVAAAVELGGDVNFVGVAGLSGSVEDMRAFVDDTGSDSIPHISDVDGAIFSRFQVVQQDTFAFVGTDGSVTLVDGYSDDPDLVGTARERFGL